MIQLPPGCTVTYAVWIDINKITQEVIDWFNLIGGIVSTESNFTDYRGRTKPITYVQYGKAKKCHYRQDGTGGVRLHFHGDDVSVASMFLLKFNDMVENHNMQQVMDQHERDHA
jgi:hypothetical protein